MVSLLLFGIFSLSSLSDASAAETKKPLVQRKKMTAEEKDLYEQALLSIRKENWDEALLRMEHFVRYFSDSPLADNALFWMAQVYVQKDEWNLARDELNRIIHHYPESDRAERALSLLETINHRRIP